MFFPTSRAICSSSMTGIEKKKPMWLRGFKVRFPAGVLTILFCFCQSFTSLLPFSLSFRHPSDFSFKFVFRLWTFPGERRVCAKSWKEREVKFQPKQRTSMCQTKEVLISSHSVHLKCSMNRWIRWWIATGREREREREREGHLLTQISRHVIVNEHKKTDTIHNYQFFWQGAQILAFPLKTIRVSVRCLLIPTAAS